MNQEGIERTTIKEKLIGAFGAFGYILFLLLGIVVAALPFVILDMPFWFILIAYAIFMIPLVGSIAKLGVFIWAFIEALSQKQDWVVIAFYVVCAYVVFEFLINFISVVIPRRR